jgi:hypothetical protein
MKRAHMTKQSKINGDNVCVTLCAEVKFSTLNDIPLAASLWLKSIHISRSVYSVFISYL